MKFENKAGCFTTYFCFLLLLYFEVLIFFPNISFVILLQQMANQIFQLQKYLIYCELLEKKTSQFRLCEK